jgi:hypothetical protein
MDLDDFDDAFGDPIILDDEVLQSLIAIEARYRSDNLSDPQNQPSTSTYNHRQRSSSFATVPEIPEGPARKRPRLIDTYKSEKRDPFEEDSPDIIVKDGGKYSLTNSKQCCVSLRLFNLQLTLASDFILPVSLQDVNQHSLNTDDASTAVRQTSSVFPLSLIQPMQGQLKTA